jgi:hypothetical protein
MADTVGTIAVDIIGNLQPLADALNDAQSLASAGAGAIGSAFNSAAGGVDAFDKAVEQALQDFTQGTTTWNQFQDALAKIDAEVGALADSMPAFAQAQAQAAEQAAAAAQGEQQFAAAVDQVASQAPAAAGALGQLTEQEQNASQAAASGADNVNQLMLAFGQIAGISLSVAALKSFTEAAIEAFAEVEKAQIAFGYLSGSAETAATAISELKAISNELALPTDSVDHFAQQLLAAGAEVGGLDAAIRAAADDAAATGNSFDSIASKIYNLAESATLPTKSLKTLALTAQELADSMGVTVEQMKAEWGDLTIDQKLQAIEDALGKFQDASKAAADSTSGDIQRMKNEWNEGMQAIGGQLASTVKGLGDGFKDLVIFIAAGVTNVIDLAKGLGTALAAIFDAIGTASAGFAKAFAAAMSGDFSGVKDAVVNTVKQIEDEVGAQINVYMDELKRDNDSLKDLYAQLFNPATPKITTGNTPPPPGAITQPEDTSQFDAEIKQFQKLADASALLLNQTKSNYSDYVATLDLGGKTAASIVGSLESLINKAQVEQEGMVGGFDAATQDLIERLQNVQQLYQQFAQNDALGKMAQQVTDLAAKYPQQVGELSSATQMWILDLNDVAAAAPKAFTSPVQALKDALQAQKQLDDQTQKMRDSVIALGSGWNEMEGELRNVAGSEANLSGVTGTTKKNFEDLLAAGLGLSPALSDAWTQSVKFDEALKVLGIDSDGLKVKLDAQRVAFENLVQSGTTNAAQLDAGWTSLMKAVQASESSFESVDDFLKSQLFQDMQDGIRKAEQLGESWGAVTAKQEAALQEVIKVGVATGQSVGDAVFQLDKLKIEQQAVADSATQMSQAQIIAIDNMNLAWKAHQDIVNFVSNTYKQIQTDIINAFGNLGKGFADAILSGQNFGSVMTSVFKQLEKQILEDLVGGALKVLGETFMSLIGGATTGSSVLNLLFGNIKGLIGGMSGMLGSVQGATQEALDWSQKAATAAVNAAVDAGEAASTAAQTGASVAQASSSMASGATSMAGASSSISSSVVGIVGAVASVIGAIASVGTFVESLVENHKLATIEENTRITAILTQEIVNNNATIFEQEYERMGEILTATQQVSSNIGRIVEAEGNVFNRLGDLWTTLQSIDEGIGSLASVISSLGSGIPSSASGPSLSDVATALANILATDGNVFSRLGDIWTAAQAINTSVQSVVQTVIEGLTNVNISAQAILSETQLVESDAAQILAGLAAIGVTDLAMLDQLTAIAATLQGIAAGSGSAFAPGAQGKATATATATLDDVVTSLSGILAAIQGVSASLSPMAASLASIDAGVQAIGAVDAQLLTAAQSIDTTQQSIKHFWESLLYVMSQISTYLAPFLGIQEGAPQQGTPATGSPITLPPGSGTADQANAMLQQLQTLSSMQGQGNTTLQGMLIGQVVGNTTLQGMQISDAAQQQTASTLNQIQSDSLQYAGQISRATAQAVTLGTQIDLASSDTNTILQNILSVIQGEATDVSKILSDADQMVKQLTALVGYWKDVGATIPTLHLTLPQTPGATNTSSTTPAGTTGIINADNGVVGMLQQLQTTQNVGNASLQAIQAAQPPQIQSAAQLTQLSSASLGVSQEVAQNTASIVGSSSLAAAQIAQIPEAFQGAVVAMGYSNQAAISDAVSPLISATQQNTAAVVAMGYATQSLGSATQQLAQSIPSISQISNIAAIASVSPSVSAANTIASASTSMASNATSPTIAGSSTVGNITINVNGAQNARQIASDIFKELRQRSPVFSQAVTRGKL